ncbi:hypothetical protein GFV12_04770 [Desulfurobacterium thermolithotrophum]|uniref:hypothetical protein n=1 Tax=Desulfurobacterium thermolithotrophum TaxID=64160 RepID=UPI0013D0CA11|nr:hypothetical protein [Desulfurobacterium thermolithotrophum]
MDKDKSLSEYIDEIQIGLEEAYPGKFFFSGSNDLSVVRRWYSLNIPLGFVLLALSDEELPKRFSLKDIDELVVKKFRKYAQDEAKFALGALRKEVIPYAKLEKLYKILQSILLEIGIEDFSLLEKLKELKRIEDIKQLEEELINFEKTFYSFLYKNSPFRKECKNYAEKLLAPYNIYWHKKVLQLTKKALIKKCLKEKYGIPDFTIL